MKRLFTAALFCLVFATVCFVEKASFAEKPAEKKESANNENQSIKNGRYLVTMMGCNDCHTSGFALSGGNVPESEWLKGDSIGSRGPWGTTYPINLRLFIDKLSADQWIGFARNSTAKPIMPVYVLHDMKEQDLRDIYNFVRKLGPAGEQMPLYVPPTDEPKTPFIRYEPILPGKK